MALINLFSLKSNLNDRGPAYLNATAGKKHPSVSAGNRTWIAGFVGGRSPFELAGPGLYYSILLLKILLKEVFNQNFSYVFSSEI